MYNLYILLLFNLSIVKATMVSIEAYIRVSVITTFTSQSTFKTIKHLKIKFSFLYIFIITTFIYQIKRQISHRKLWRRPTLTLTLTLYLNGMSTQEMEFMVDSISSLINGKSYDFLCSKILKICQNLPQPRKVHRIVKWILFLKKPKWKTKVKKYKRAPLQKSTDTAETWGKAPQAWQGQGQGCIFFSQKLFYSKLDKGVLF